MKKWRCGVINKITRRDLMKNVAIKDCLGGGNDE